MNIHVNQNFKDQIVERYEEAKKQGVEEIVFDEKTLGNIKLYINKKPSNVLSSFKIEDDNVTIYIGGEEITA